MDRVQAPYGWDVASQDYSKTKDTSIVLHLEKTGLHFCDKHHCLDNITLEEWRDTSSRSHRYTCIAEGAKGLDTGGIKAGSSSNGGDSGAVIGSSGNDGVMLTKEKAELAPNMCRREEMCASVCRIPTACVPTVVNAPGHRYSSTATLPLIHSDPL
ncbi:hypothetical protein WN48_03605 [Eufriesea mexicana]|nr:hypothetical protein WN48_03605 [Eufriesea mexicana]